MRVLIYPNLKKKNALECAESAISILNKNNINVYMDSKYKSEFKDKSIFFGEYLDLVQKCDVIITIGGDGTILRCVKVACQYDKPILGINSGRLGFMASVESDELELLNNLVNKEMRYEERMMLSITHISNGHKIQYESLNDVVIARPYSKIAEYSVFSDNKIVSNIRADGLVISTPTGSTAYSLSAGGPIVEPDMECIELSPICSHSLFSRTILFSPNRQISISINNKDLNDIYFSVDGEERIPLNYLDTFIIKKSDLKVKLIDIKGNTFFDSVNNKLMKSIKGAG